MTKLFSSSNGPCRAVRYVSRAVLFILLCSCGQEEQNRVTLNEHKVITISLPDDTSMRFFPVWLGIDRAERAVTDKRTLDSHTASVSLRDKEKTLAALPAGAFVGKRNDMNELLYYLGETEVSRGQWNSLMSWMDKRDGKSSITDNDKKNPDLPRTNIAPDKMYRFIEALNLWTTQELQHNFPNASRSFIFFRLPTEAEWDFAARGGINVLENNPECFTHRHPYKNKDEAELRGHEWCKENTYSKVRECGSLPANPIGLKDMLGNVEEITTHLFSSEYKHCRYGKLVICGNNYSDSSHDFAVMNRTKYIGAEEKVGVRIALGSAVRYGIGISKERENQNVTHDLRMKDDFKDQIEKLKGEKEELASEIEKLRFEVNSSRVRMKNEEARANIAELRNILITSELNTVQDRLIKTESEVNSSQVRIKKLEQQPLVAVTLAGNKNNLWKLQGENASLKNQNKRLESQVEQFKLEEVAYRNKIFKLQEELRSQ